MKQKNGLTGRASGGQGGQEQPPSVIFELRTDGNQKSVPGQWQNSTGDRSPARGRTAPSPVHPVMSAFKTFLTTFCCLHGAPTDLCHQLSGVVTCRGFYLVSCFYSASTVYSPGGQRDPSRTWVSSWHTLLKAIQCLQSHIKSVLGKLKDPWLGNRMATVSISVIWPGEWSPAV
jgi:hypothetical protein